MNHAIRATVFGILMMVALGVVCANVHASPILDVNVIEVMYEDNNWNGFCYNCIGLSGDTNAFASSVYGNMTDINGTLIIKNTSTTTDLSDIVVYVGNVEETTQWSVAACTPNANITFWDSNSLDGNILIHIRDLGAGASISCTYDINNLIASTPLVMTEDYTSRTMSLSQVNPITLKLVNNDSVRYPSIYNVSITKIAPDYNNNGIRDFNYNTCNSDSNGTVANCNNTSATSGTRFDWTLASYALNDINGSPDNPVRMTYNLVEMDPNAHNTTGFYPSGRIDANFASSSAITSLTVGRITAIAPSSLQVFKRQDPDANSGATYDGYDWGFNLAFTNNTQDVNFQINKMSMWITINKNGSDPHNYLAQHDFRNPNQAIDVNKLFANGKNYMTMPAAGSASTCAFNNDNNHLECQANPANYKLGTGSTWWATFGEDIDANGWWIDKNLAGDPQNPDGNTPWIPVIWGDANFTIANDEYDFNILLQQNSYSLTTFMYIIHDYIVEAKKTVTRISPNDYNIFLWVHNRGNKNTPQNVYVYDVIPNGFDLNHTPDPDANIFRNRGGFDYNALMGDGNQPIYATHGWDRNGIAYWWNVGPLDANSTGLRDEATIQYFVIGSGDYNAMNLFIVGVDPIQTDIPSHGSPVARLANLATTYTQEEQTMAPLAGAALIVGMLGGALIVIKP